jgi:hypothetical protein
MPNDHGIPSVSLMPRRVCPLIIAVASVWFSLGEGGELGLLSEEKKIDEDFDEGYDGEEGEEGKGESIHDIRRLKKSPDSTILSASESTEVSIQSTRFITESKTQRLNLNSHRNDGRGLAPLLVHSPRPFIVVMVKSCGMSPSLLDPGLSLIHPDDVVVDYDCVLRK